MKKMNGIKQKKVKDSPAAKAVFCRGMLTFLLAVLISTVILKYTCISVLASQTGSAADSDHEADFEAYRIEEAWWEEKENGSIVAKWRKPSDRGRCQILLYRCGKNGDELVARGSSLTGTKSLSRALFKRGTGLYFFTVRHVLAADGQEVESDIFEIDEEIIRTLKRYLHIRYAPESTETLPDKSKGTEPSDSSADTKEVTGQPEPAAAGDQYDASASGNEPETATIRRLSVSIIETEETAGTVSDILNLSVTGSDILELTSDTPSEKRVPGKPVRVTAVISPRNGYKYSGSPETYSANAKNIRLSEISENKCRISFDYIPHIKLTAPSGVFINDEDVIRWDRIEYAQKYKVKIIFIDEATKTITVTSPCLSLQEKDVDPGEISSMTITAAGADSSTWITSSAAYKVEDMAEFLETHRLEGRFTGKTKMRYQDADGEYLKGWNKLAGYVYCFDDKGVALGPGWYEEDGKQYYFDENHRAVTGKRMIDGILCEFSDGTDGNREGERTR